MKISQARWHVLVVPATREAEAGGIVGSWKAEGAVSQDQATALQPGAWHLAKKQDSISKKTNKEKNKKKKKEKKIQQTFLSETMQIRRQSEILKVLKKKTHLPRIPYPSNIVF